MRQNQVVKALLVVCFLLCLVSVVFAQQAFDPTGLWRHAPEATWAIKKSADGKYFAEETGLGFASGPAYFTPLGTFRIDYTTKDGSVKGFYEVKFSPDGKSASGIWHEITGAKRSGPTNWTLVSAYSIQQYHQINFTNQYNHGRLEGPWAYEGIPLLGYQGKPAPIVWLTKCKAPNNDNVCYPQIFQWNADSALADTIYVLTNLSWWGNNLQGKTIAKLTVIGTDGRQQDFDLIVGKHTAEWNGGSISNNPPHVTIVHPQNTPVTSRRFLSRFQFDPMTVAKIRVELLDAPNAGGDRYAIMEVTGITLANLQSAGTMTSVADTSIAGLWDSTEGRLTLTVNGNNVSGTYPNDDGRITGVLNGNVLNGYWSETHSAKACPVTMDGRLHWGRIQFTFTGDTFIGKYGYCNDPLMYPWSGKKLASSKALPSLTFEANTDRFGSDYRQIHQIHSANDCKDLCAQDSNCKAYTWVKPGVQAPQGVCYLKNPAPPQTPNNCCISGIKQ